MKLPLMPKIQDLTTLDGRVCQSVMLGRSRMLYINSARQGAEGKHHASEKTVVLTRHAFLHCDGDFRRVIFPAPEDFDLLLFG